MLKDQKKELAAKIDRLAAKVERGAPAHVQARLDKAVKQKEKLKAKIKAKG